MQHEPRPRQLCLDAVVERPRKTVKPGHKPTDVVIAHLLHREAVFQGYLGNLEGCRGCVDRLFKAALKQGGQVANMILVTVGQHHAVNVTRSFGEARRLSALGNAAVDQDALAPHLDARHRAGNLAHGAQKANFAICEWMNFSGWNKVSHRRQRTQVTRANINFMQAGEKRCLGLFVGQC
jgi:hypothetical protein